MEAQFQIHHSQIGATVTNGAFGTLTGIGLTVDNASLSTGNTSGIATVTTTVNVDLEQ